MNPTLESKHKDQVKQTIKKINQSWLEGHPEKLSQSFHENMMIVSPDFKILGAGKATCIKSYSDFVSHAIIKNYQESDPDINVWGNTATAFYHFEIAWEMDGKLFQENGQDFFVFTHENGNWLAVWRMVFSAPRL